MSEQTALRARALAAVAALAARKGLATGELEVLSDQVNLLVALPAAGLVARVATTVALVRPAGGLGHQAREVSVARFLADRGLPVVPPAPGELAGPHREDGLCMSLWQRVPEDPALPLDAAAAGRGLRAIHEALAGATLPGIPAFEPLTEVDRLLDLLDDGRAAAAADLAKLRAARLALTPIWAAFAHGPKQILHGDAHLSNCLRTPAGPGGFLWNDFEDVVRGPVAWDLACLAGASRTWGPVDPAALAALAAYGPEPAALHAMLPLRALLVACWVAYMGSRHAGHEAKVEARLAWWRAWSPERPALGH